MKKENSIFSQISVPVLFMALLAFGTLLLVILVGIPRAMEAYEMQSTIENEEKKLASLTERVSLLRDYQSSNLRDRLENTLLTVLPVEFDVPFVLAELNQIAEEQTLKIDEISTRSNNLEEEKINTLMSQEIDILVIGASDTLEVFLTKISELAPLMTVKEIVLENNHNSNEIQAEITIETFAYGIQTYDVKDVAKAEIPVINNAEKELLYSQLTGLKKLDVAPLEVIEGSTDRNLFDFQ